MTATRISWYLCGLFMFALLAQSAATYAPGAEGMQRTLTGVWAALAMFSAVAAIGFMWQGVSGPRWLVRALFALAVLATLTVLMVAVG